MSYKRITTPKVFTDWVNWMRSSGKKSLGELVSSDGCNIGVIEDAFDGNPVTFCKFDTYNESEFVVKVATQKSGASQNINYVAFLGHGMKSADASFRIGLDSSSSLGASATYPAMTGVVNGTISGGYCTPSQNGWTLVTFTPIGSDNGNLYIQFKDSTQSGTMDVDMIMGCIMTGMTYDFKTRPSLSHKISKEFDNKLVQSLGGARYSVRYNNGHNLWAGEWTKWTANNNADLQEARVGRTIFNLSWSFVNDTDMFREVDTSSTGDEYYVSDTIENMLLHKVHGSHNPFIIQLDPNDHGSYYLVRMTKHSMQQTAPNLWTFSCTLEEEL